MIERTKKKLSIDRTNTDGRTRMMARIPDGCSNVRFVVYTEQKRDEDRRIVFTLYKDELLALKQLITDWEDERIRVKQRDAISATKRKATHANLD